LIPPELAIEAVTLAYKNILFLVKGNILGRVDIKTRVCWALYVHFDTNLRDA